MPGKLYLIPSFLGEDAPDNIPEHTKKTVYELDEFIVENAKTARRYLRAIGYKKNFDTEVLIHELDKHEKNNPATLLKNVIAGKNAGIISEAGNPCIADPGNTIVHYAHQRGVEVCPLIGPSSILLALISSGMNGQNFSFNGYLPIQSIDRQKKIKFLEELSSRNHSTQLFMETPFRSQKMLEEMMTCCKDETLLCVACDLTLPTQFIKTAPIRDWRKTTVNLHKRYCIFLLSAA